MTLLVALALLAGGSGVIKPNISTLMGQTYDQQAAGAGAAPLGRVPLVLLLDQRRRAPLDTRDAGHPQPLRLRGGVPVPRRIMVASLIVFALGKPYYAPDPPARQVTEEEGRQRRQTLGRLLGVFALFVFFWIGYEQSDAIWIYFMRDHVDLHVPLAGWAIAPDQLQFLNPLIVVVCVPLFGWLFRRLDPAARVITSVRKIFAGFLFATAAPAIFAVAGLLTHGGQARVSLGWPLSAWCVLTLGEILLYGTGLELAYAAAPASMKSFVTACFLLTSALADFVNMWFVNLYNTLLTPAAFFAVTAAVTLVAGVAFLFVGRRLEPAAEPRGFDVEPAR